MGGEFTEEKNFTRGKKKNWWEKCNWHFKMRLLYSKLILLKEGSLFVIQSASRNCNVYLFLCAILSCQIFLLFGVGA